MRSTTLRTVLGTAATALLLLAATPAMAGQVAETFDFALDEWMDLDATDGPITLYRVRLDKVEGRLTKATVARPYNPEFVETVRLQLEYTNESSSKWNARLTARWLDEDGDPIDGISANEKLDKKSARKITQVSLVTLKYGLERARTLEVEIHYEP